MSFVDVLLANHMFSKVSKMALGQKITLQSKEMFEVEKKLIVV